MTAVTLPHTGRSFSKVTGQYTIELDYDGLTELMDAVFQVWDSIEAKTVSEETGNMFSDLVDGIARLREYTGWGGVPTSLTGIPVAPARVQITLSHPGLDNGPWGER